MSDTTIPRDIPRWVHVVPSGGTWGASLKHGRCVMGLLVPDGIFVPDRIYTFGLVGPGDGPWGGTWYIDPILVQFPHGAAHEFGSWHDLDECHGAAHE